MQHQQHGQVQDLQHRISPRSFSSRDRSQSSFSTMSRYHPYRAAGDTQQKPYFPEFSAALGTLSPRYSVPACSALAGPTAASHPYDAMIGAVYVPSRARTSRNFEKVPFINSVDNRAAVLSRAKQVLRDSQVCAQLVGVFRCYLPRVRSYRAQLPMFWGLYSWNWHHTAARSCVRLLCYGLVGVP